MINSSRWVRWFREMDNVTGSTEQGTSLMESVSILQMSTPDACRGLRPTTGHNGYPMMMMMMMTDGHCKRTGVDKRSDSQS